MKPSPNMTNPIGTPDLALPSGVKVGIANGGGGVKVGKCVGASGIWKAATDVGLMVGVVRGVAVGGGSMIGKKPGESDTSGAYTQPFPPGTPRYTI